MKKYTVLVLLTFRDTNRLLFWRYEVPSRDSAITWMQARIRELEQKHDYSDETRISYIDTLPGFHYGMANVSPQDVYDQLEPMVLPHLEQYHEDLTSLDKSTILSSLNAGCPFVLSYNPCGTHMALLNTPRDYWFHQFGQQYYGEYTIQQQLNNTFAGKVGKMEYPNTKGYVYFDGSEIRYCTREEALSQIAQYKEVAELSFTDQELAGYDYTQN